MNYDIIEATSFEEVLSEIEENGNDFLQRKKPG